MEEKKDLAKKEYYLSYVIDDDGLDETIRKKVDFVSDNLFDYPKIEIGGPVDLIEVDPKTKKETILHTFAFVSMEESEKRFGIEEDEEGFRTFLIYLSFDTISIQPYKIKPDKIQCIDGLFYLMSYEQEHQKRVAELIEKAKQKKTPNQPDGSQPGDE